MPPSGQLIDLGAVVGGVHDDGVVGDAQFLELLEQLADHGVVLDHAVGVNAEAGLALALWLEVRPDVHAGGVPPDEERLAVLVRLVHEVQRALGDLFVDRLHALLGQRAGVLARSACPTAKAWVGGGDCPLSVAVHFKTPRGPNIALNSGSFG